MKRYITILSACLLAFSCAKMAPVEPQGEFGYIDLGVKSGSAALEEAPAVDMTIKVYDFQTNELVKTFTYSEVGSVPVAIAPGEYRIEAESCTEEQAQQGRGRARYAGQTSFEVVTSLVKSVKLECKMVNAKVEVNFDQSLYQVYESFTVRFEDSRQLAVESSETSGAELFWNVPEAGLTLSYRFSGTKSDGTVEINVGTLKLKAATCAQLNLSANL